MIKQGFKEDGQEGDLFLGAAEYYAQYRRPYPPEVVSYIVDEFGLDGRGRLLDGGCGTGQVFSVLGRYFEEVVAFDADEEMLRHARRAAERPGLPPVTLLRMKGEEITPSLGVFRMAVFGASFHWMDREHVAELVYERLEPGGHIVLLAPSGIHSGTSALEEKIREVVTRWLGPQRRAGGGVYRQGDRHETVLAKTRFGAVKTVDIYVDENWTVDEIVGWLYSTSYASKEVLKEKAAGFEQDLRRSLLGLEPGGNFVKAVEYTVISAPRPAA